MEKTTVAYLEERVQKNGCKVNSAQCSSVEVGNVCMRLQVECSGVVRESRRTESGWKVESGWHVEFQGSRVKVELA